VHGSSVHGSPSQHHKRTTNINFDRCRIDCRTVSISASGFCQLSNKFRNRSQGECETYRVRTSELSRPEKTFSSEPEHACTYLAPQRRRRRGAQATLLQQSRGPPAPARESARESERGPPLLDAPQWQSEPASGSDHHAQPQHVSSHSRQAATARAASAHEQPQREQPQRKQPQPTPDRARHSARISIVDTRGACR
jgi:hypothetical protein